MKMRLLLALLLNSSFFTYGSVEPITVQGLVKIIHTLQEHAYRPLATGQKFDRRIDDIIEGVTAFYNEQGQLQSFELQDKNQLVEKTDETNSFIMIKQQRLQIIRAHGVLHFCMPSQFLE